MFRINLRFSGPVWLQYVMIWVLLSSSTLLLLPQSWLPVTWADAWQSSTVFFIVGILTSLSYFLTSAALMALEHFISVSNKRRREEQIIDMLERIDFNERAVLREFWIQRKSVILLPTREPSVKNLLNAGILEIATDSPSFQQHPLSDKDKQTLQPMVVSLPARPLITFKVMGLNPSAMTSEQIQWIKNTRPRFAYRGFR